MDLSKADRAEGARVYLQPAQKRDARVIANVLREHPEDCIDQHLALGAACPYWPNQVRERAGWIAEIRRQQGESEVSE